MTNAQSGLPVTVWMEKQRKERIAEALEAVQGLPTALGQTEVLATSYKEGPV